MFRFISKRGYEPIDVELGKTSGSKQDVFLLLRETSGGRPTIWRRTKTSSAAGTAWGKWARQYNTERLTDATGLTILSPGQETGGVITDDLLILAGQNVYRTAWNTSGIVISRGLIPFYPPKN